MKIDENLFFCRDAGEVFLERESVDLFIGHPPYYQAELERNGGDPAKQMQNVESIDEYYQNLLYSFNHMEWALKPEGNIFVALDNGRHSLGVISRIEAETDLRLHSVRLWDYSGDGSSVGNKTVVFAHFRKTDWYPGEVAQGPFVLNTPWEDAYEEIAPYNQEYATVGTAPSSIYVEMITNFSKEGDVVCDLFAGGGTVQLVAAKLGRKFIYNDVSEDKVLFAKKRISDYLTNNN
jgi:DNA modification methylase